MGRVELRSPCWTRVGLLRSPVFRERVVFVAPLALAGEPTLHLPRVPCVGVGKLYGYLVVSAVSVLLARVLPMALIAEAVLAFCLAAALHAVLFRWYAWMYRTSWRKLLVRYVEDRTVYRAGALLLAAWFAAGTIHDHGSFARVIAVEAAFFLGMWLTLHPREVKKGLVQGIRDRL
jgi:hypothetical protein